MGPAEPDTGYTLEEGSREVSGGIKEEPAVEDTWQGWDWGSRKTGARPALKAMETAPQTLEQNCPWNDLSSILHIIASVQQASWILEKRHLGQPQG